MGFNDHIDFDLAIQDLLDEGMLEEGTPAYGKSFIRVTIR